MWQCNKIALFFFTHFFLKKKHVAVDFQKKINEIVTLGVKKI